MKKLIAVAVVALSLAACSSGPASDQDQVLALGNKAVTDMKAGNSSALAGLMNPACVGDFITGVAMAKAFGVDLGEILKAGAADIKGSLDKKKITITGDTAKNPQGDTLAVKVDGKWYLDCSDFSDTGTKA